MVHCKHFCVKDRGDNKRMERRALILILLSTRKAAAELARNIQRDLSDECAQKAFEEELEGR